MTRAARQQTTGPGCQSWVMEQPRAHAQRSLGTSTIRSCDTDKRAQRGDIGQLVGEEGGRGRMLVCQWGRGHPGDTAPTTLLAPQPINLALPGATPGLSRTRLVGLGSDEFGGRGSKRGASRFLSSLGAGCAVRASQALALTPDVYRHRRLEHRSVGDPEDRTVAERVRRHAGQYVRCTARAKPP